MKSSRSGPWKTSILAWVIAVLAVLAVLVVLALTACGQVSTPDTQGSSNPFDVPTTVSILTPPAAVATGGAPFLPTMGPYSPGPMLPSVSPVAHADRQPSSTRVEPGKPYPFTLYTHCGVDFSTDFDGSFWDAADKGYDPRSLDYTYQEGTMTLLDNSHARFDWDGRSLNFVRHVGPKAYDTCK